MRSPKPVISASAIAAHAADGKATLAGNNVPGNTYRLLSFMCGEES